MVGYTTHINISTSISKEQACLVAVRAPNFFLPAALKHSLSILIVQRSQADLLLLIHIHAAVNGSNYSSREPWFHTLTQNLIIVTTPCHGMPKCPTCNVENKLAEKVMSTLIHFVTAIACLLQKFVVENSLVNMIFLLLRSYAFTLENFE